MFFCCFVTRSWESWPWGHAGQLNLADSNRPGLQGFHHTRFLYYSTQVGGYAIGRIP